MKDAFANAFYRRVGIVPLPKCPECAYVNEDGKEGMCRICIVNERKEALLSAIQDPARLAVLLDVLATSEAYAPMLLRMIGGEEE